MQTSDEGAHRAGTLVERVRQGDQGAFDVLMRRHERRVFAVAWRLLAAPEDAQDAVQEVFLRLYRHIDGVDPARPLEAWLYRVTVNVCHDLRRRRQQHAVALDDSIETLAAGRASDPATVAEARDERRLAERALKSLGEKERAALVLRDLEGLSTAEVARVLGSSEVTVRTHVCRARLKMKKLRESWQETPP